MSELVRRRGDGEGCRGCELQAETLTSLSLLSSFALGTSPNTDPDKGFVFCSPIYTSKIETKQMLSLSVHHTDASKAKATFTCLLIGDGTGWTLCVVLASSMLFRSAL